MSRPYLRRSIEITALFLLLCSLPIFSSAQAQPQRFLEYDGPPLGEREVAPPNCSMWHELWPEFCRPSHQDNWQDSNGDGQLSACDFIILDGIRYHVDWVGPTFVFQEFDLYLEPLDDYNPLNPMCEIWLEIFPNNGVPHHVDQWQDANGDGRVSPCDFFFLGGIPTPLHLDDIRLDIRITEAPPPVGCFLCCPGEGMLLIDPTGSGTRSLDLNGDGIVNVADFAMFAAVYGSQDFCANFTCSGPVNLADFAVFASHFGHVGPVACHCAP